MTTLSFVCTTSSFSSVYSACWVGENGTVSWPPRSPDLTPLDFFLWGHMKSVIFETPVNTQEELAARIVATAAEIREHRDRLLRVHQSVVRRAELCIQVNGRRFLLL